MIAAFRVWLSSPCAHLKVAVAALLSSFQLHSGPDHLKRQTCRLRHVLAEHREAALADVRGRRVDHDSAIFNFEEASALVRQSHTDAGIFHRAGDAAVSLVRVVVRLHGFECLFERR